ncbi:MAG: hypothetical protein ABI885_00840 [Gammaproteobacteria bacterium]
MILRQLQDLIGAIYDVKVTHDVYDFLVTDRAHLPHAARCGTHDEQLILAEQPDAVGVSLYLDPALLERLSLADPMVRLNEENVADYWTALEGVSHFLYFAWNAGHDRPVSLLELELQAEIDKYVASYLLLKRQFPERFPAELLRLLFERTRVDPQLNEGQQALYRAASRHAEKFCRRLDRSLRGSRREEFEHEVLAELRRVYRLGDVRKVAHIEKGS